MEKPVKKTASVGSKRGASVDKDKKEALESTIAGMALGALLGVVLGTVSGTIRGTVEGKYHQRDWKQPGLRAAQSALKGAVQVLIAKVLKDAIKKRMVASRERKEQAAQLQKKRRRARTTSRPPRDGRRPDSRDRRRPPNRYPLRDYPPSMDQFPPFRDQYPVRVRYPVRPPSVRSSARPRRTYSISPPAPTTLSPTSGALVRHRPSRKVKANYS